VLAAIPIADLLCVVGTGDGCIGIDHPGPLTGHQAHEYTVIGGAYDDSIGMNVEGGICADIDTCLSADGDYMSAWAGSRPTASRCGCQPARRKAPGIDPASRADLFVDLMEVAEERVTVCREDRARARS
jgi:hypothetical protein